MNKDGQKEISEFRKPDHPVIPLILSRWSPRAMSGEALSQNELFSLFEAARWAPSSYNNQPWHFIYASANTPNFFAFLDLLVPFNQLWAAKAAVLGAIASHKLFTYNNKPSITHAFDTGAAWENLCLEGASRGLVVHGIEGFDYTRAKTLMKIPDDYDLLAMFVIGKRAPKETLSEELQKKEKPSSRLPIEEFISEGIFKKKSSKP